MRDSFTNDIKALMVTILIISLLPAAVTQKDNAAMNITTLKNLTELNKTNDIAVAETNQSMIPPEGSSVLLIGKGLSGEAIGTSSLNKGNIAYPTKFQTDHGSIKPELALGSPLKPMKDLEKVVFICNIL